MKKNLLMIVLLIFLASCSGNGPAATMTPTLTPLSTATRTTTPTDTPTPTDTLAPTEAVPDFYAGLAPTLEQFTNVDRSDISAIIDRLASQPSLLTPDSEAPEILQIVHDTSSGDAHFTILCNQGGAVNCAPAASVQIAEQGIDPHIIIWEIRNSDGSRGYFPQYTYDSFQHHYPQEYNYLLAQPFSPNDIIIHTGMSVDYQVSNSGAWSLMQQPGFQDAVQQWIDNGNVPESFNDMILPY